MLEKKDAVNKELIGILLMQKEHLGPLGTLFIWCIRKIPTPDFST